MTLFVDLPHSPNAGHKGCPCRSRGRDRGSNRRRTGRLLRRAASRAGQAAGAGALRHRRRPTRRTPSAVPEEPDRDTAEDRAARREEQEELAWEAVARTPPGPICARAPSASPSGCVAAAPGDADGRGHLGHRCAVAGDWSAASGAKLPGPVAAGRSGPGRLLIAIGGVIGVRLLAAVAIYGVTILRETAAGGRNHRRLAQPVRRGKRQRHRLRGPLRWPWPLCRARWPRRSESPARSYFLSASWCFFAPFLLSALEAHSPLYVVSPAAWRAVTHAWRAWCLFYLLVSALAIAIALIVLLAGLFGAVISAIVAGFLLAAGSMIYFRLLGRLAWFCSGRWAWEDDSRRMGEEEDS